MKRAPEVLGFLAPLWAFFCVSLCIDFNTNVIVFKSFYFEFQLKFVIEIPYGRICCGSVCKFGLGRCCAPGFSDGMRQNWLLRAQANFAAAHQRILAKSDQISGRNSVFCLQFVIQFLNSKIRIIRIINSNLTA